MIESSTTPAKRQTGRSPVFWSIVATSILLASYLVAVFWPDPTPRFDSPVTTLAVLPFVTESSEADEHLATGLADDLLTRLQYLSAVQCIPRAQVRALANSDLSSQELGRELGAEIVVSGLVRQTRGTVHLTLDIDDATRRTRLSSLYFERSSEAIFDLQKDALSNVVDVLRLPYAERERELAGRNPTRSLKAWDYESRGRLYLGDLANQRAAEFAGELFQRAVQLDPDYSEAHSGLSESLWIRYLRDRNPASLEEAERQARAALKITPERTSAAVTWAKVQQWTTPSERPDWYRLAAFDRLGKPDEAMRQLAIALLEAGELGMAESAWRSAVARGEYLWLNWYNLGGFLRRGGRFAEAEAAFGEAAVRCPKTITWPQEEILKLRLATGQLESALQSYQTIGTALVDPDLLRQIGAVYASRNRWQDAETAYRLAVSLEPDEAAGRQHLAETLSHLNRPEEAQAQFLKALATAEIQLESDPDSPVGQRRVALLAAQAGHCDRALPMAATLRRYLSDSAELLHDQARVFAICGDHKLALETLRMAFQYGLLPESVRADRAFESMTADAEFQQLLVPVDGVPPSP